MSIQYTTDQQIEELRRELRQAEADQEAMRSRRTLYALRISARVLGHALFYMVAVSLLVVLLSVLVAKNRGEIPSVFGFRMFVVESGSMSPTLRKGKVILSKMPKDPKALVAGDIITFRTDEGAVVTHRIIEVLWDEAGNVRYRTKGDNPVNSPDSAPVLPEDVIAVYVFGIPFT